MTRQQKWAKGALEAILAAKKLEKAKGDRFRTLCMKTPTLVKQSGLIQAIAFLSRDDKPFVDELAKTYGTTREKLQSTAASANLQEYMAMTRDFVSVAVWFRRFAQAELGDA